MSKQNTATPKLNLNHLYAAAICLTGIGLFALFNRAVFIHYTTSTWVWVYALAGAAVVLTIFTFQLPPQGNGLSLDSSVYLACIFVFGPSFSLTVLLVASAVIFLIERKTVWWKHLINFAVYSIINASASYTFAALGGVRGPLMDNHLAAYAGGMAIYFIMNTLLIVLYYYVLHNENLYETLKGMLKDTIIAYLSTLVLSLVLTILLYHNHIFGLALFLCLSILLSYSFKQMFTMYRDIEERANRDPRTGLFNHSYFEVVLEEEMRKSRSTGSSLSLAMIDIDDFKKYNDHFGHLKGDGLIVFLAELLKKECGGAEMVVSRYGGEEFTLLMPSYDTDQAKDFLDRLRKTLNNSPFDGTEIFPQGCLSFSAGIAGYRSDIHDKSELVEHADQALYYAKKQGKNMVHIYGHQSLLEQDIDFSQDVRDIEQQLNLFMYKDMETFKHSKRVFRYAMDISELLKLDSLTKRQFTLGALIHDIGKLEIPWGILNKKEKLTPEEWEMVKWHVTWGKQMAMTNDKFKDLAAYIELHHERYDGRGYPHGFKGEEIPKLCRMLTIIDSFDAMTTERPYQPTKSVEEAIVELRACAGSQFDPGLTEFFISYIESRHLRTKEAAV
ncbi:bifunctional diguanylate cyclase/phosphohydrolase [Paenibacillus sabinae]|uniref:Diguanylate cyclase and metal dependent phosphohydrolase n=1 Tax=Paenibacillus sabinae T27 TaxID=1268072 RepID=X4ZTS9_9BACL|nr:diguanylate cyclase [Paenibacillus sabinae]AHV95244.1 diguanylate cyclase and metal dependent phosphohydrolase [Paenibacillus sabinae T27]